MTTTNPLRTQDLSVGSNKLDSRNRAVFNQLANVAALVGSIDANQLARSLRAAFTQFENLLLEEEAELAEIAYPELVLHRKLHEHGRNLIRNARMQLLQADTDALVVALTRDSCAALSLWLMRHVIDVDKLFFPYIDARFRVA